MALRGRVGSCVHVVFIAVKHTQLMKGSECHVTHLTPARERSGDLLRGLHVGGLPAGCALRGARARQVVRGDPVERVPSPRRRRRDQGTRRVRLGGRVASLPRGCQIGYVVWTRPAVVLGCVLTAKITR
jgi:hypothetical protein